MFLVIFTFMDVNYYIPTISFKGPLSPYRKFVLPIKTIRYDYALIKCVSVTYKCYEMYAHRGKNVQLLVF